MPDDVLDLAEKWGAPRQSRMSKLSGCFGRKAWEAMAKNFVGQWLPVT